MAAAVFIPPSPHDPLFSMATSARRAPLTNIPNATNSPARLLTNSGSKRNRTLANLHQQENEPPHKRQALEKDGGVPVTPRRRPQPTVAESKVFERGTGDATSNAFQRRLVAARDRPAQTRVSKNVDHTSRDVENIRQWQKHYRKLFPTFSFYFDSVPDDLRARFVRQINHFGSREEKFFSKSVTHIVTTRSIPAENASSKLSNMAAHADAMMVDEHSQTINPSLLERSSTTRPFGQSIRRDPPANMDILTRGRQMGMKIWASEKLQRVLSSMLEDPNTLSQNRAYAANTTRNQEDLSQVLRNEKIGATADREQISIPRETISFRGPFIYVHDMDEKFRPTMIREYPKVARRQDGEWPQFRSATVGKCPFVEDPGLKKEEQERAKQKALLLQQAKGSQQASKAAASLAAGDMKMDPPRRTSPRKALQEVRNPVAATHTKQVSSMQMPAKLERQSSFPPMPEQPPSGFVQPAQMHLVREPAASGIQRSNITSAIQSQMISSTAATGVRAATSKNIHDLNRKVLERTHTGSLSVGSIPSSHRMTDLAGALKNARAPAPQRAAKSKAQEKLGGVNEDVDPYADDIAVERVTHAAAKKKKPTRKDPKPGYCENCRDKYDDFEEHVISRKHRKFAMTQSNWDELDALLRKLQAP